MSPGVLSEILRAPTRSLDIGGLQLDQGVVQIVFVVSRRDILARPFPLLTAEIRRSPRDHFVGLAEEVDTFEMGVVADDAGAYVNS